MTHERLDDDGNIIDEWEDLGPAEDIEAEPLDDVEVGSEEPIDLTVDPASHVPTLVTDSEEG